MATLKAVHDKIIMKLHENNDKVINGIIIPDTGKERSNVYEVIDVGTGLFNADVKGYRQPMSVEAGDLVIVPKAVVYEIQVDGETYYMTREVEIQAILKD